jgi:hypothetical protein
MVIQQIRAGCELSLGEVCSSEMGNVEEKGSARVDAEVQR